MIQRYTHDSIHRKHDRLRLLRTSLILVLFLTLCAQWPSGVTQAAPAIQSDTTITLTQPIHVQGCEIVEVMVQINDVINLYGADVRVTFNPQVLEVVDQNGNLATRVENAGFLVPHPPASSGHIFVVKNEVDNVNGSVRYAATLLNPAPAINGSGNLIRFRFRAKAAGSSNLQFAYWKLAAPGGLEIPSTAIGGTATTSAPASVAVNISRANSTTARLSWPAVAGVARYHIYRETTPYFAPSGAPYATPTTSPYDDVGALGDVTTNYFYVMRSACTNGFESANSNRVGEFDYRIRETAGSDLNWIAIPLDSSLLKASDLYAHLIQNTTPAMNVFTIEVWTPSAQSYQVYDPISNDFSLKLGGVYRVTVAIPGTPNSAVWTIVGSVPEPTAFSYTLRKTATSDLNWIMLPLDRTAVADAQGLQTAIESEATPTTSVLTVEEWNPVGQNFTAYSSGSEAFGTRIGYPYRITVDIQGSTSSIWP